MRPMRTKMMVVGGVTTQYDQKMVREMSRSKASPDAACVICANVRAGGEASRRTFATIKTGSSNTAWKSYLADSMMRGINTMGVKIILERTAMTTVFVSPFLEARFFRAGVSDWALRVRKFRAAPRNAEVEVD